MTNKKEILDAALRAKELDEELWSRAYRLACAATPYDLDPEAPGYWELDSEYKELIQYLLDTTGMHGYNSVLCALQGDEKMKKLKRIKGYDGGVLYIVEDDNSDEKELRESFADSFYTSGINEIFDGAPKTCGECPHYQGLSMTCGRNEKLKMLEAKSTCKCTE